MSLRINICVIVNLAISIMTAFGLKRMMSPESGGALLAEGLSNLKFFTVLSNIFAGGASFLLAAFLIFGLIGSKDGTESLVPRLLITVKFASTVGVALTFLTVMFFLGPLYGYDKMFRGANLFFHLLIPVAAIVECFFIDRFPGFSGLTIGDTLAATVPMLLYGIYYYINVLKGGMVEGRYVNDWYGFMTGGAPMPLVFIIMFAFTWIIAVVLRFGGRKWV